MSFKHQYPLPYEWGKEQGKDHIARRGNQPEFLKKMAEKYLSEIEELKLELENEKLTEEQKMHKGVCGAWNEGVLSCFD